MADILAAPMFLATTAIEAFWDSRGPLLFLGAWCVPWAERRRRVRPGDVILPSVWDDRTRFYGATLYVDECVERLLGCLSEHLDHEHRERHGVAYWRVILGPWLINYVHAAYDRWAHLHEAFTRVPELKTVVLDPASYRTPRTGPETLQWLLDDGYNLQICSQLLEAMGHRFPTRAWRPNDTASPRHVGRRRHLLAAIERAAVSRLKGRVGVTGTSLSFAERWRVAAATRGDIVPVAPIDDSSFVGPDAIFDSRRHSLADLEATDAFERAIIRALPVNFPTLYLEGHPSARMAAQGRLRQVHLDTLLSETDWYANEAMKHLAAEAAARGTKLIAVQHGGGYGMYRFSPGELHERRISDQYLVWGWGDDCRLRNWPSAALSRLARTQAGTPRRDHGMLFVATTGSRYLHWFNSQPGGTQLEAYFEWQTRFLETLPTSLHRAVTVRPHTHTDHYADFVWPRIAARFSDIVRDKGRPFARAMQESRLLVIDHCGTTLLQAFVADVPVVLFWDPARWETRPSAQPFFDELRGLGILHDDPESAARHVECVFDRAAAWWRAAEIQDARCRLVERFALHRTGGAVAWAQGLADEVARA